MTRIGHVPRLLVALTICLLALSATARAESRIALVIGNGSYARAPLANPVSDARAMRDVLSDVGFEVEHLENASERQMKQAIRDFGARLPAADVRLFYFAGHGVQSGGRNYLIPVDVDIQSADEVEFDSVEAGRVLAKMESARGGLNIVLLDACRDNPFYASRGGERGLAITRAPRGSIISYATSPGETAADGRGRHSPYTRNLVSLIGEPGLSIEAMLKEVRRRVARETNDQQVPWENSSLFDEFYFVAATSSPETNVRRTESPSSAAPTRDGAVGDASNKRAELDALIADYRAKVKKYEATRAVLSEDARLHLELDILELQSAIERLQAELGD